MMRRHLIAIATLTTLLASCRGRDASSVARVQADQQQPQYAVWTCSNVGGSKPTTQAAYDQTVASRQLACAAGDVTCMHNFGLYPCILDSDVTESRASMFTRFFREPDNARAFKTRADEIFAFVRARETPSVLQQTLDVTSKLQKEAASYQTVDRGSYDDRKHTVLQELHDRIASKAGAERADLIQRRQTLQLLESIATAYRARLQALAVDQQDVVTGFAAYRADEAALVAKLLDVRDKIEVATTLEQLPPLQDAALAISAAESGRAETLADAADRLERGLFYAQTEYERSIKPYVDFIAKYGFATPHPVDDARNIAGNVSAYCQARDLRVFEAVAKLLDALAQRGAAIQAQLVADGTRQTLSDAAYLRASAGFLDELNALVQRVWTVPPKSTTLKLPYLRERYDAIADLLGHMRVCQTATGPIDWMQDGCRVGAPEVAKVNTYMSRTLPGTLTIDVALMRKAGLDNTMLKAIEADVAAGNLRSAVLRHDVAVRASEVAP
jgi:hypothetical protein